ncbi:MAG: hypothetical protein RLY93_16890 [Sumerlaeia bacterium]
MTTFRLTLTAALLACLAAHQVFAQDDPFAMPEDSPFEVVDDGAGEGAAIDPFAASGEEFTEDPFAGSGEAIDPFSTEGADPFAGPGAGSPGPADPFGMDAPAQSPFGGGMGTDTGDPFADPGAAPFGSPEGAGDFSGFATPSEIGAFEDVTPASDEDPFALDGGEDPFAVGAAEDPFGVLPTPDTDLIGGPGAGPAGGFGAPFGEDNPFAGATDVAETPAEATAKVNPDQLVTFRYDTEFLWNGREIVVRKRMSLAEAQTFDDAEIREQRDRLEAGEIAIQPGASPQDYAQWLYYYDQLDLWSQYVDDVVLARQADSPAAVSQVQWPGSGQAGPGQQGQQQFVSTGGANRLVEQTQNQSLDDQVGGFFVSPQADGQNQPAGFPPSTIETQVVDLYNTKLTELRQMEEEQQYFMAGFLTRIQERINRRLAYQDWLNDQQLLLREFAQDWNRRYNGDVEMIGGVRYELYAPGNVPNRVPRNTNVVITDHRLTPYDILTEDGQLREAARQ